MGLKDWYKAQSERHKESKSDVGGFYGAYALHKGELLWDFRRTKRPIAGATAVAESGADNKNVSLARVGAGFLLAGPAGAVVGGLLQKDRTRFYITVTFADQSVVIIDGPIKDETEMRQFAHKINAASRHYSTE